MLSDIIINRSPDSRLTLGIPPDKIVSQIFKDLVSKSNGSAGLNFLKSLTKMINLIGDGKIPISLRPFFFGAKLIALIKIDGGLRPIVIGNTLRRISHVNACARSKALSERPKFFRKRTCRMRYQTRSRNSCTLVSKPN